MGVHYVDDAVDLSGLKQTSHVPGGQLELVETGAECLLHARRGVVVCGGCGAAFVVRCCGQMVLGRAQRSTSWWYQAALAVDGRLWCMPLWLCGAG